MSAFDGIFGSAGGDHSALFSDVKPSAGRKGTSASTASAAAGDDGSGALDKRPKADKADKSKKRQRKEAESAQTPDDTRPRNRPKSGKPAAAAAAAAKPTAVQMQPAAKRQKPSKAANIAVSVPGESAAARMARAAAAKLLNPDGVDQQDIEVPPLHETLQQAAKGKQKKQKKAPKQQPPPADQQAETPAERIQNGDAAAAEQPLDAAPNGVEQAEDQGPDDKLDRTIFVGNLHAVMKPKAIKQLFSRYGSVESVRLRSVPVQPEAVALPRRAAVLTGKVDAERATAHAYVVFAAPEQAQAALAHNMVMVDGLHVRVDMATDSAGTAAAKSYSRGRSIFVGNLPFTAQDEDIVRMFSDDALDPELAGAVTAVRVVRGRRTNIGKGIAFVEFKSKAAAAAAMRLAEPKLHGRPLRITFLKQPKASAVAGADGAPVANIGGAVDSSAARERLRKQKMAAGSSSKKTARQPWMGERTKGPQKAAAKGRSSTVAAQPKAGPSGVKTRTGFKPAGRPPAGKQGRKAGGRPPATAAGRTPGGRGPRAAAG